METLIQDLQVLFGQSWGLGLQDAVDAVLARHGWEDGSTEMSFSGITYRTRVHPRYGEWRIEATSSGRTYIEIFPVNSDGFTVRGDGYILTPTPEQTE